MPNKAWPRWPRCAGGTPIPRSGVGDESYQDGCSRHPGRTPRRANRSRRCERRGRHRHPGRRPGRPRSQTTAQVVGHGPKVLSIPFVVVCFACSNT
ncbi:hypothetical protein HBB16_09190 [Pseudonocardia sp. MCCB 268]|nr:hypothetical protein [Pseudonocardia cytotoxica]